MEGTVYQRTVVKDYDLLIDGNTYGGCQTCNDRIVYFDFKMPNGWSFFYIRDDGFLKAEKIRISKPNELWRNDLLPKMFEAKTKENVKSTISKIPTSNDIWYQIKTICEKAFEYAGDIFEFKNWLYDGRLKEQL